MVAVEADHCRIGQKGPRPEAVAIVWIAEVRIWVDIAVRRQEGRIEERKSDWVVPG